MPSGRLLGEVFQARSTWGWPSAHPKDYVSLLAWEHLGIPLVMYSKWLVRGEVWNLSALAAALQTDPGLSRKTMDGRTKYAAWRRIALFTINKTLIRHHIFSDLGHFICILKMQYASKRKPVKVSVCAPIDSKGHAELCAPASVRWTVCVFVSSQVRPCGEEIYSASG